MNWKFWNWDWTWIDEAVGGDAQIMTPIITKSITPQAMPQTENELKLYTTAKGLLGQVLAADNAADGYGVYGCAESVNAASQRALGKPIGGGASVELMWAALQDTTRFQKSATPRPGGICICVTGTSTLGAQLHGHVGIPGINWFMSNDSETATWEANYTQAMWEQSFAARGFTTHYFAVL